MIIDIAILVGTLLLYIPLAGTLLYVWWKHGKGDRGVVVARRVYLTGSFFLFVTLITI